MKYRELVILLPCHSLEDFPMHHKGEEAAGLLACWSALWHPALLASAGALPAWYRADSPPGALADRLVVAPKICEPELPTGFAERALQEGGCFVSGLCDCQQIVHKALQDLDGGDGGVDAQLAADFLALGYCYLQIELLTRQMRYSSNLDEAYFRRQAVPAAEAALAGDADLARTKLTACFDLLAEERDHYYPVDAFLLDLTLVAPTTLGDSLRRELATPGPVNLLLGGALLQHLADTQPETLAALRRAEQEGRLGLAGGELVERRLPLLPCEAILGELRRGEAAYQQWLGRAVRVFGRRRFGLTPALPQILRKLGFKGALHATMEEGRFPVGAQMKVRWEGNGQAAIDAVAKPPLDGARPETFLALAGKMGESMDVDHVATIWLAHWPGQTSLWRENLRCIGRYGAVLGKRVTLDQYFEDTDVPGQLDRFKADQYRSPYLKQAVQSGRVDPLSTSVRYWRRRLVAQAAQALDALAGLAAGRPAGDAEALLAQVDQTEEQADVESLDARLEQALADAQEGFAASLPRDGAAQAGYLVTNPQSFPRRVCLETPALDPLPAVEPPVYAASSEADVRRVIVDVPPLGFTWVAPGRRPAASRRTPPPLAAEHTLRNEFFEAHIQQTTGTLQSVYLYGARGNRLSQQLAFRFPAMRRSGGGRTPAHYSVMAADSVQVTHASSLQGEITARGRLLDGSGHAVAGFEQVYRITRGSRVLELCVRLEPEAEPGPEPWQSYYACRFAWANEAADLWRSVNESRQAATARRLEAPLYLEIDNVNARTAILTGGLPFHQRQGRRMLDTLLIVRGERAREFRLGMGFDVRNALHEAVGLLAPPPVLRQHCPPPAPSRSSWLLHVDARNILATYLSPLWIEGKVAGFRTRLLETAGRATQARVRSFRDVAAARQLDFQGQTLNECRVEQGRAQVNFSPHEWIELEARW